MCTPEERTWTSPWTASVIEDFTALGSMLCICIPKRNLGVVILEQRAPLPQKWIPVGIVFKTENFSVLSFQFLESQQGSLGQRLQTASTAMESVRFMCETNPDSFHLPTYLVWILIWVTKSQVMLSGWSRSTVWGPWEVTHTRGASPEH